MQFFLLYLLVSIDNQYCGQQKSCLFGVRAIIICTVHPHHHIFHGLSSFCCCCCCWLCCCGRCYCNKFQFDWTFLSFFLHLCCIIFIFWCSYSNCDKASSYIQMQHKYLLKQLKTSKQSHFRMHENGVFSSLSSFLSFSDSHFIPDLWMCRFQRINFMCEKLVTVVCRPM